jgi:hypothetical protein
MRKTARVGALGALGASALLLAAVAPAEDLTITYTTTGRGNEGTSTQYLTSERTRSTNGKQDTLFDFQTGTWTSIDHEKKQYSQMTVDEMEAAMNAASAQMEEASAEMANMPAAVRERMQSMLGGGGEATLTRGGQREIAGYSTQEYVISSGDSSIRSWTTTDLQPPVSLANIRRMTSVSGPLAAMAANPMFKGMSQMVEKMKEIEGFPQAS